jgi:SAM-dependent methyltransferase
MGLTEVRRKHYPETLAGGFSKLDGTIQFYSRVQALIDRDHIVMDIGAGRGAMLQDDDSAYRRDLMKLRGRCARIIGVDVDPAVLNNPFLDEAHVILLGQELPLPDASVDLILSDYTFEHIDNPAHFSREIDRVLKPGGWLCARTPNRWSLVGMAVNAIPNSLHTRVLGLVQMERKREDVFPTRYRMNSFSALRALFPTTVWDHATFTWNAEPVYVGTSSLAWSIMRLVNALTPRFFQSQLNIFLHKKA